MEKGNLYKIIGIIAITFFLFFGVFTDVSTDVKRPTSEAGKIENTITISVILGGRAVEIKQSEGASFYSGLIQAEKEGKLSFNGKVYPRLGFFVTEIGDLKNGSGKHLFYYINSKEARVGVSYYLPKNGDVIEWKLK